MVNEIRGMRVGVRHMLELLADCMTPEQILQDFPYLEKADIDASLEYAARHAAHREILLSKKKFLVDANLPPRLCVWLRSHRHEAEHLFDRNLLTATDTQIWECGRVESLVILSKDVDCDDRALPFGTPPQVVHLAVGNCSNARLFEALAREWAKVERTLYPGRD